MPALPRTYFGTSQPVTTGEATSQALSQLDLDRAEWNRETFAKQLFDIGYEYPGGWAEMGALTYEDDPYAESARIQDLTISEQNEEDHSKRQHLDMVYGSSIFGQDADSPAFDAGLLRSVADWGGPRFPVPSVREWGLRQQDTIPKVNELLAKPDPDMEKISDSIRDLTLNEAFSKAKDAGLTKAEAYVLPNVPDNRRDFEGFTNLLLSLNRNLTQEDIDKFASGEGDRTLKSFTRLDPAKEAAATMGYLNPEEFGLDPFTNEQIREARATFQRLMEETPEEVSQYISPTADPYIYQDQVAEALQKAQAEQTLFTGEEVDVASRAPVNLAEILRSVEPPPTPTVDPSPFIGEPGFTPSLGGNTLGGPVVGSPDVPSGFEALASLIQDDPNVAQKYISGAGPTAELANLVANTGVETFTDIPETTWTPPAPVVPDITQELADFSAIRDADEDRRNREQDERERELEQAADNRREAEQEARVASARNKTAEKKRIDKENKERKAEEKRIADSQAAAEKKRRASDKQMADMLKLMNETHQAYLDRKKEEEERRLRQGYGVGDMWT